MRMLARCRRGCPLWSWAARDWSARACSSCGRTMLSLLHQRPLNSGARACVARIEMPFSAREHPKQDLARLCLARLQHGEPMVGVVDQRITPVFLDDAARALRRLVEARYTGVVHVAAADWTTPY